MAINRYIAHHQIIPIENVATLIAGDSHPQKSLNPKYFENAQNISQTAEPYVITYWKLKKILQSINPEKLIIGFAPHNISQFNDFKFSNERWSTKLFERAYPIEAFRQISEKIRVDYKNFVKVLWRQTGFYPKRNHINYIGKYQDEKKQGDIYKWERKIKKHYYLGNKPHGSSEVAISYLDSIINLCNSKNIDVILVSNPVHQKYFEHIPPVIMKDYTELAKKYSTEHIVFDRTKEIYVDSLFLDADHLNPHGAKFFSIELIKYLKNLD